MTASLIVIEIAAPTVSADALSVLVSACTRAARHAECVLAKEANDRQPSAVAIVSLQADDKMRVEVGLRQVDRDSWRTKEFSFLAADDSLDRWRVVGFAIGTLAETNPAPSEETLAAQQPASVSRPPLLVPRPSKLKHEASPQLFVGAGMLFGRGLDRGPLRLGGALYAGLALPRLPVLFKIEGSAATRVSADASGTTARWFDVSVGVGVPLLGSVQGSALELGGAVLTELFAVSASAQDRSETETNSRWTLGLQGALGGRLQLVPDLVLTAEVLAAGLSGTTEVSVSNSSIGRASSFRYLGSVGLRVQLR